MIKRPNLSSICYCLPHAGYEGTCHRDGAMTVWEYVEYLEKELEKYEKLNNDDKRQQEERRPESEVVLLPSRAV